MLQTNIMKTAIISLIQASIKLVNSKTDYID